ncbi:hypothetical protein RND81_01G150400 [Saponaria officinalis]|uniref:Peptidase C1A papain C-terminal domain-containing protein n=1 Tax=Saponaria officinalis TaxID=3572 RepID=A0AAW1NIV9_SAPOF
MATFHLGLSYFLLLLAPSLAVVAESSPELKLNSNLLQDSIIHTINSNPNAGWKAGVNHRFSNFTVGQFKRILGARSTPKSEEAFIPHVSYPKTLNLPKEFDARKAWPQCSTIGKILDQGHCGSCWAFGAVESLSDRFCIHFGVNVSLSVNDLLACCGIWCGAGCNGGTPIFAWRHLKHFGVVTNECDPYFDNTGCSHPGCEPAYPTPKCVKKCVNGNQLWKESKHYAKNAYKVKSDPHDIMAEVYTNGPVEVGFSVYEDFAHYKSGVYKHVTGGYLGGHAVKLIGWGTSAEGEDYWLIANQWNRSWGDDGYFMIKRGTNECGIEGEVVAGMPSSRNMVNEVSDSDSAHAASM